MTPLFPAQRAAEEFEKALGGTATQAVADRYSDLLETVEVLRTQPEVLPRVEFVDELRLRLMTAAETELVAAPERRTTRAQAHVQHPPPARHRRRLPRHRRRHRRNGRRCLRCPARRAALPGQAGRGAGRRSRADERRHQGRGPAQAGRHPPRRGPRAPGPGIRPIPSCSRPPWTPSAAAADEGSQKLFTAYQAEGNAQDITTVRDFTAAQMADVAALAARTLEPRDRREPARRRRHPGRHRPAGARPVRHLRSAGSPRSARRRSAQGPARPPWTTCSPARSSRQQVDVAAVEAARNAALKAGASAAEADRQPRFPSSTATTGAVAGATVRPPSDRPSTSSITKDGTPGPVGHRARQGRGQGPRHRGDRHRHGRHREGHQARNAARQGRRGPHRHPRQDDRRAAPGPGLILADRPSPIGPDRVRAQEKTDLRFISSE